MATYELAFYGGKQALPDPIRFEAADDAAAKEHADETWEKGTYTTSAKGCTLRNVSMDGAFYSRERRNGVGISPSYPLIE